MPPNRADVTRPANPYFVAHRNTAGARRHAEAARTRRKLHRNEEREHKRLANEPCDSCFLPDEVRPAPPAQCNLDFRLSKLTADSWNKETNVGCCHRLVVGTSFADIWVSDKRELRCTLLASRYGWDDTAYEPGCMKIAETAEEIETLLSVEEGIFDDYQQQLRGYGLYGGSGYAAENLAMQCLEGRDVMAELIVDPVKLFEQEHVELLTRVKEFCWHLGRPLLTVKHVQAFDRRVYPLLPSTTWDESWGNHGSDDKYNHYFEKYMSSLQDSEDEADYTTAGFKSIYKKLGFSKLNCQWQTLEFTPLDAYSNWEHIDMYSCCNPDTCVQRPPARDYMQWLDTHAHKKNTQWSNTIPIVTVRPNRNEGYGMRGRARKPGSGRRRVCAGRSGRYIFENGKLTYTLTKKNA